MVSILWLPILQNSSDGLLFDYIQSITSYLGPPVVTVFVMGIFWERTNEPGAFWGLICGLVIGLYRMINEFALPGPHCGEADFRPIFILSVHYLYFAIILAGITVIITGIISLLSPPIDRKFLYRLTWWSRFSTAKRNDIDEISKEKKRRKYQIDPEKYPDPDAPPENTEGM